MILISGPHWQQWAHDSINILILLIYSMMWIGMIRLYSTGCQSVPPRKVSLHFPLSWSSTACTHSHHYLLHWLVCTPSLYAVQMFRQSMWLWALQLPCFRNSVWTDLQPQENEPLLESTTCSTSCPRWSGRRQCRGCSCCCCDGLSVGSSAALLFHSASGSGCIFNDLETPLYSPSNIDSINSYRSSRRSWLAQSPI